MKNTDRSAYTLFELLAVLTVSGIIFTVILGSWNSWSVMHATNGAADILKSEIRQARSLAVARNRYVGMELVSYTTNGVQHITSSQLYISTNDSGNVESLLSNLNSSTSAASQQNVLYDLGLTSVGPVHSLSGQVRITSFSKESAQETPGVLLFFRPDGSIWNGENTQYHYIAIYSRRLFNEKPLSRLLHIDLTTGAVNLIKEEY